MTFKTIVITAIASIAIGYLSANYYERRGYPFWKTFIMGSIAFFAVAMMLVAAVLGDSHR